MSVPITQAQQRDIAFVSMSVQTDPTQIKNAAEIRTLPEPERCINVLIRVPREPGQNLVHQDLADTNILLNPRQLIYTILAIPLAEGGNIVQIGIQNSGHMGSLRNEEFNRWHNQVQAKVTFALLETLLYRDFVGTEITTSPEANLYGIKQAQADSVTKMIVRSSVARYYNLFMTVVMSMWADVAQFQVNVPKCFFDGLEPDIQAELDSAGNRPTAALQHNYAALDELASLKAAAVHAENKIKRLSTLARLSMADRTSAT